MPEEEKTQNDMVQVLHPADNPRANLKSISHRCYLILVASAWVLTKETIKLPPGCLQGGERTGVRRRLDRFHFLSLNPLHPMPSTRRFQTRAFRRNGT